MISVKITQPLTLEETIETLMKQDVSRDTKDVTIQNCSTDTNKQTKLQVMVSSVPMIGGGAGCLLYFMYGGGTGESVEVIRPYVKIASDLTYSRNLSSFIKFI